MTLLKELVLRRQATGKHYNDCKISHLLNIEKSIFLNIFELAVIKQQAEPLLEQVPENCDEYAEAYRLLKFLRYIKPIPEDQIPPTSLLREFLGGSSFEY